MVNFDDLKKNLKDDLFKFIPILIKSFLILMVFLVLAIYSKKYFNDKIDTNTKIHQSIVIDELGNIIYYIILFIGVVIAIVSLGIHVSTIITLLAAFGLAIGLGLKNLITNIISGIYITFNNLFKIGDIISVNGETGQVIDFNLFTTTIINEITKIPVIIPNTTISENSITNLTIHSIIFININIPNISSNSSNLNNVSKFVKQILKDSTYILSNDLIYVHFSYSTTGSGSQFTIYCPIYSKNYFEAEKEIKDIINNNISYFY